MATLTDLIQVLARITGVPEATLFATGRFAREAGYISQAGRGRGGAEMTVTDAANLLIGACGPMVIKDAPRAIQLFRTQKGNVRLGSRGLFRLNEICSLLGIEGLSLNHTSYGEVADLSFDFGYFLERMIGQSANLELLRFLKGAPVAVYSIEASYSAFDPISEAHEVIKSLPQVRKLSALSYEEIELGTHSWLDFRFDRALGSVQAEIGYFVGDDVPAAEFDFGHQKKGRTDSRSLGDLGLVCRISELTILALGFALANRDLPTSLKSVADFQRYFSQFLGTPSQVTVAGLG